MARWYATVPPGGPKQVEEARARVGELRARVAGERDRLEQAKRDVASAERADRDSMAAAFAAGREPSSDVRQIERLRAAVGEAERRAQALDSAIVTADQALGDSVDASRDRWLTTVDSQIEKAREAALDALGRLDQALGDLVRLQGARGWLQHPSADQPPAKAIHDAAPSSARALANGQAVSRATLLAWIAETLQPVEDPSPAVALAAAADAA